VGLVERSAAFAMAPSRAVDGYWFADLHFACTVAADPAAPGAPCQARRLDPEREWALAAQPAVYPDSGRLTLLAGSSGHIWARDTGAALLDVLPLDPAADGWTEVRRPEELDAIPGEQPD